MHVSFYFVRFVVFCLETTAVHPNTKESFTIPLRQSQTQLTLEGDCKGTTQTMVRAQCVYSEVNRKSTWQVDYMPCDVACLKSFVTHSVTDETFPLPTAGDSQLLNLSGMCGSKNQVLVTAYCTNNTWQTTERECVLTCNITELSHSQWSAPTGQAEYNAGHDYGFNIPCNGGTKMVMSAHCDETAQWQNVTKSLCVPECKAQTVEHPIGQRWTLNNTGLNKNASLDGLCNGESVPLVTASCQGNIADGGQWLLAHADCIARCSPETVEHPASGQAWSLASSVLDHTITLSGECNNASADLGMAICTGNPSTGGVWNTTFNPCEATCPPQRVVHPIGKTWQLLEGSLDTNQTLVGMCNSNQMTLADASCQGNLREGGVWVIQYQPCDARCAAVIATHPIGTTWQLGSADFGHSDELSGLCNNQTSVLVEARCVGDMELGGEWNITYVPCEAECEARKVAHGIGTTWNLDAASLGTETNLSGFCDNQTETLATASCTGDHVNGAAWDITYRPCDVKCSPKTITHPDTKVAVSLSEGRIDEAQIVDFMCDGKPMPVQVVCEGSAMSGAVWKVQQMPGCSPMCAETHWYDPVTLTNYTVSSAALNSHSTVKSFCGGSEMVRLLAECHGDIITGLYWENEEFECNPSCNEKTINHVDVGKIVLPSTKYNESYTIKGQCNGEANTSLASAQCGGSRADVPSWYDVRIVQCIGFCEPVNVSFSDGRPPYRLPEGRIGDREAVNGTCALRSVTEIEAECTGSAESGGEWVYNVYRYAYTQSFIYFHGHSCKKKANTELKYCNKGKFNFEPIKGLCLTLIVRKNSTFPNAMRAANVIRMEIFIMLMIMCSSIEI